MEVMNKNKANKDIKNKGGRPKKPVKERLEAIHFDFDKIKKLAGFGLIDEQFAKTLDIEKRTWDKWKKEDKEFSSLLKNGKEFADKDVEASLWKRANGYQYQEVTRETVGNVLVITKVVTKEVVPDVGAIAFWLKNRQPDKWKERNSNTLELPEEQYLAIVALAKQTMINSI